MRWPRKKLVKITYHDAVRWRRRDGWLTFASLFALYLAISVLTDLAAVEGNFSIWNSLLRVLIGMACGGSATWNYVSYRKWDRRVTAMGVVLAQASASELLRTGVYTEEEADEAFSEHMRGIG